MGMMLADEGTFNVLEEIQEAHDGQPSGHLPLLAEGCQNERNWRYSIVKSYQRLSVCTSFDVLAFLETFRHVGRRHRADVETTIISLIW
jgi:hypothetical protein